MTQLEIVHLRASGESIESLADCIRRSVTKGGGDVSTFTLYRRHGLETDLAVHVIRRGVREGGAWSELALRLASALRVYGLVEHTRWEELR